MRRRIRIPGAWSLTLVVALVLAASSPSSAGASVVIESPNSVFNKGSGSLKLPGYGLEYFKCNSLAVKGTVPSMPDATASISEFAPSSCAYYNIFGEKLATASVTITGFYPMKALSTSSVELGGLVGEAAVKLGEANCKLSYKLVGNLFYSSGPTTNTLTGKPGVEVLSSWGSPVPPCPWSGSGGSELTLNFPDPEFEVKEVTFKAPTVSTKAASSITQTGATLNGEITPNGLTTEYHFEYGLKKEEYGTKVPVPDASITSGPWTVKPVSQALSQLVPGTTYHFRLVAKNKEGTSYGSDQTFTTWGVPLASVAMTSGGKFYSRTSSISSNWVENTPAGVTITATSVGADLESEPVFGVLGSNGHAYAKVGQGAAWIDEYAGAKLVSVARDPKNGPFVAIVDNSGVLYAKQGLTSAWVKESEGVKALSIGSDSKNGIVIGIITESGDAYAKQGLTGAWVKESEGVKAISVSGDSQEGPIIGIITENGEAYAKQGLTGAWVSQGSGVSAISVAGDSSENKPLIASVAGEKAFAKQGLSGSWIEEYSGAKSVSAASTGGTGPLLGIVASTGHAYTKQGLAGAWKDEFEGIQAFAIAN